MEKKKKKKSLLPTGRDHTDGRHIYMIVYVPKERKKKENRKSKMSGKQNRVFVCFVALIAAQSAGS